MTLVVALGDSTSCGEGVGLRLRPELTWPARVVAGLPGSRLRTLAVAGARVRDVRTVQLAPAAAARPDVATLLVGLNDVSRGGFHPDRFADDLRDVVRGLRAAGALVLLGRLHDPTAVLPLPPALRSALQRRTAAVNAAVDACRGGGVQLLDLAAVPGLRSRRAWDVDRLHPNAAGHALVAAAALRQLAAAGRVVRTPPAVHLPPPPGRAREVGWVVRHGLPWLSGHVPGVVLPAVGATVRSAGGRL